MLGLLNSSDDFEPNSNIKLIDNFSSYGTIVKVTSEERTLYSF